MPACTCRNCGELNVFTSGPIPAKVKCASCGNTFRTGGTSSPQADEMFAQFENAARSDSDGGGCAVAITILTLIGIAIAVYFIWFSGG